MMESSNILATVYKQYMHASQWLHHHTFLVVAALTVFATV